MKVCNSDARPRVSRKKYLRLNHRTRLFHVLQESTKWGDAQGIETVGDLNDKITRSDVNELVLVQEALQEEKIAQIAEQVRVRSDVRFVLIAGPSSSSKTTFSHRLSVQLRAEWTVPLQLQWTNYFKEREETPKDLRMAIMTLRGWER